MQFEQRSAQRLSFPYVTAGRIMRVVKLHPLNYDSRMNIDWQPLKKIIDENQRFLLSSHARPDADAIGSELGLACILEHQHDSR